MEIEVIRVTEYNAEVRRKNPDGYYYHTFRTRTGEDRLTGWVASYKKCHFFGKTKKDAYNRCAKDIKKW